MQRLHRCAHSTRHSGDENEPVLPSFLDVVSRCIEEPEDTTEAEVTDTDATDAETTDTEEAVDDEIPYGLCALIAQESS